MNSKAKTTNSKTKDAPLLLLFDGHSMAYRAFHALPETMTTSSGQVTNMLVGFLNTFFRLYKEHRPEKVAVCFDLPIPTFRHKKYQDYKANRPPSPETFRQQLGLLHEILSALGVPMVELAGFEADDLLASLASLGAKSNNNVLVVTGDRDCFQLVKDPKVQVLYTPTKGDAIKMNENEVEKKVGVSPKNYLSYAALKGDASDNLPGVPGIGEKRAADLINGFKNIDDIYANLSDSPKITPSVKTALGENRALIDLNLDLMKLKDDVQLDVQISELKLGKIEPKELERLLAFLELRKFDDDIKAIWDFSPEGAELYESVESFLQLKDLDNSKEIVQYLKAISPKSVLALAERRDQEFLGFALGQLAPNAGNKGETCEVIWIDKDHLKQAEVIKVLKDLLDVKNVEIVTYSAKPLMRELLDYDIQLSNLKFDSRVAAYLLNPQDARTSLEDLAIKYGKLKMPDIDLEKEQLTLQEPDIKGATPLEAVALLKIYQGMLLELEKHDEVDIYKKMEIPLIAVLAKMEYLGIAVDVEELKVLNAKLERASKKYRKAIIEAAGGVEFNVNSTRELGKVLFEDLKFPPQKRTKQGFSTDAATLEKLKAIGQAAGSPNKIVDYILEYRNVEKLRSTYGAGLLKEVKADGKIHTTFNQTVARTGRLSSDAPNLHNIPIRTELGREFRKVFVVPKGCELLVADYNQIELRCIAHLCGDPNLIEAFKSGVDVHSSVAERVFGVVPVPKELRERAKMISYGLMYGMEAYGLSQRLNVEKTEAQTILENFFAAYPSIKSYMENTVATARELGYTKTLFGRKRYIPELKSGNHQVRAAAERQAMNSGIQGLAADIFKNALVGIHKELQKEKLASGLILQVHDEVILEVPKSEKDLAKDIVKKQMEGAAKLDVPLVVDLSFGKTWDDAKKS